MPKIRELTGVFIDPENNTHKVVTIKDTLPELYSLLRCDLIDIVDRVVGDTPVSIICDDEGLLRDGPYVSAVFSWDEGDGFNPAFVGPIFVVGPGATDTGELISLTEGEVMSVVANVVPAWDGTHGKRTTILCNVNYPN